MLSGLLFSSPFLPCSVCCSMPKERCFQFSWRPRLPSLLPPEKDADIAKNLKAYAKKYDEEDEQLLQQADADVLQVCRRHKHSNSI